ncbi:MAG: glycosyltransferase family 2 protein [Promethearchaeota archaeon]|nr:MAG: glycosyltransferase family 2 protein [Candidatus Lokiarchaeota archaeon]
MKSLSINPDIKPNFREKKLPQIDLTENYKTLYEYLDKFKNRPNKIVLSIILPLYNEENTIRYVLEVLPQHPCIEIIIVDDCSEDRSLEEIKKVDLPIKLRIIKHHINRGYGGSIMTGVKYSLGDIIITMDSDGQHSPDDIYNLIEPIINNKADYAIGSRYLGSYFYTLPLRTRLGESMVEKALQILFGIKIVNNQNGFRAFKRELIPIFENAQYKGYAFCTELIIKAKLNNYRVVECPIKVYDREYGKSKIRLIKLAYDIFFCISQYSAKKLLSLTNKKFIKSFKKVSKYMEKLL